MLWTRELSLRILKTRLVTSDPMPDRGTRSPPSSRRTLLASAGWGEQPSSLERGYLPCFSSALRFFCRSRQWDPMLFFRFSGSCS